MNILKLEILIYSILKYHFNAIHTWQSARFGQTKTLMSMCYRHQKAGDTFSSYKFRKHISNKKECLWCIKHWFWIVNTCSIYISGMQNTANDAGTMPVNLHKALVVCLCDCFNVQYSQRNQHRNTLNCRPKSNET